MKGIFQQEEGKMWDKLKNEIKGWNTDDIEAYIENYGFRVCTKTSTCVHAIDKYGFGEYFYK